MDEFVFVLAMLAALGTALLAGSYFAFSAFLMRALRGLSAERGIVAMQAITLAIRKRVFLIVFSAPRRCALFFRSSRCCIGARRDPAICSPVRCSSSWARSR